MSTVVPLIGAIAIVKTNEQLIAGRVNEILRYRDVIAQSKNPLVATLALQDIFRLTEAIGEQAGLTIEICDQLLTPELSTEPEKPGQSEAPEHD